MTPECGDGGARGGGELGPGEGETLVLLYILQIFATIGRSHALFLPGTANSMS